MFRKIYDSLRSAFSQAARRDDLVESALRDLSRGDYDGFDSKAYRLIHEFPANEQAAAALDRLAHRLHAHNRPDLAENVAWTAYRRGAEGGPLRRAAADVICARAGAIANTNIRRDHWSYIAMTADPGSAMAAESLARWTAEIMALPTAAERAEDCIKCATIATFPDSRPSPQRDRVRAAALDLASPEIAAVPDPGERVDMQHIGIVLTDAHSPAEERWVRAWEESLGALRPPAALDLARAVIEDRQPLTVGRGTSALWQLDRPIKTLPAGSYTAKDLVTLVNGHERAGHADESRQAALLWRQAVAALPAAMQPAACEWAATRCAAFSPPARAAQEEWCARIDGLNLSPAETYGLYHQAMDRLSARLDGHDPEQKAACLDIIDIFGRKAAALHRPLPPAGPRPG